MADLDSLERSLAIARAGLVPPASAKARVRAKLDAAALPTSLPSAMSVPATKLPAAVQPATAAKAGGVTKLTTAALVGMGFVTGYWLGSQHDTQPARRSGAVLSAATPPRATAVVAGPSSRALGLDAASLATPESSAHAEAAATAETPPASAGPSSAPNSALDSRISARQRTSGPHAQVRRTTNAHAVTGTASDPFAEELALLERAERAIRSDQAALALSFLNELDQRFPRSSLLEERTAARVLADCALGEPLARERAELFQRDRLASVYTDRVRRMCKLEVLPTTVPWGDGSGAGGH